MCGIAGFFSPSRRFSRKDLSIMTGSLSHRGPDAEGFFFNETTGLGHRRLSIFDLSSAANQPMFSADQRYVMVFNGEIYNFKELAPRLRAKLKTTSDSEVLLEGLAEQGLDFVQQLNGMFAFALYDLQENVLYVFRDRMGIKPLFYYWSGGDFAFASETKALLSLNIDRKIDQTALNDYLFLEYIPSEKSIFQNIQKLAPGHFLKVTDAGIETYKYYDITDHYNPLQSVDEPQLLDSFSAQLSSSISYQALSDVPLGAFLSGGIDSSLICSIFQQQQADPVNTFTIGFNVKKYDERAYARRVADLLKTNHRETVLSEEEAKAEIPGLVKHYDEPFAAPSALPSLQVCRKARAHVKVAISGDGADELFMGYGYYNWHRRIEKLHKLGGYPARKMTASLLSLLPGDTFKRASGIIDYSDYARIWIHIWSQEQYMFSEDEIGKLTGKVYRHETMLKSWEQINEMPLHAFEKISLFDLKNYLPSNLLYKMDIASMAHGLEVRVPYLDHQLVEFSVNVPLEFKIRHGEAKYLLKKLLERYLPKELVYRKKWGFPAPVETWLQSDLSPLLEKYLNKRVLLKQGLFDPEVVLGILNAFRNGKRYYYKRIWALLFFQMWYKEYIDNDL